MKSLYQLYDELLAKDIKIAVKGSNLHLTGNKSALTPELIAALTAQKEPLVSWLTEKQDQDLGLPTTAGQRALWSLSRLHNNEIHNLVKTFRLNKELKQEQLSTSLLQLIQSHRVLRSVYRSDKDQELRQFRLPSVEFQITTIHSTLENLSTDLKAYVDVPFDLSKELPLRAAIFKAEDQRYFVLVVHHIAVDHSAYQILLEQLATLVSGESLSIEDNYERFIHEQSKYNSSPEKVADRLFWQESFQELTRRQDQPQEINSTDYHYFSFDEYELQPALKAFARDNGLTPYSLFLAVFNLLQFFSTGEPNVIVATPALNRNVLWSKKIIGFLANVIPIPTVIDEQQSLQSCCQQLAQTIVQGLSHQSLALSEMTKTKSALATQAMFVWHQDVSQAMQLFRQHIGEELFLLPSIRGIHEPILLIISPTAESYHFELYFNRSLFKKTEAEFWIQQFKLVYRQLIINAQQNVEQLFIAQLAAAEMLPPLARYEHADFYRQSLNRLMVTRTTPADLVRFCYELLHNHCVINDELYDTTIFERQFLKANNKIKSCKLISKKHKEGGWHNVMYFVADELLDTRSLPAEIQAIQVYQFPLLDNGDCAWYALEQEAYLKEDDKQYILEKIRQATGFSDVKLLTREQMNASALLHLHEFSQQNDSVVANQHYLTLEQEAAGPQALVHGPELIIPSQAPITLTEAFCLTAKQFPEKGIYHYNRKGVYFQSYGSLYQRALHILSGLQARGLKPQNKIILQIPNLADHLAVFWAAILGGIIPVTVAIPPNYSKSNAVVEKLLHVWLLLEQPLLISGQANQVEVAQLTELYSGMDFKVETVEQLEYPTASELIYSAKPTDVVFYQLTSGSTGKPKCIQETHRGIIAHIHGSSQTNGYRKEDICLNWLPLDHVVPILTYHLKNVYLGCTQIEVLTELIIAEPLLWLDLIEKHAVTHSWSPNFGFKLLSEALKKEHGKTWQLASLKKLMNAGEQVTKLVCDLFLHRVARYGVEQAVMQPAFGMAEACTCMTYLNDYSSSTSTLFIKKTSLSGHLELSEEGDDAIGFVNLGTVMPGVAIRITDAQNRILPELVIGRFQIHGAVITPGYYANSAANQEAFQEDGWFDSGDLGFIYQGCLYLTGRQKETIIINGTNFYCYEIEDLVNTLPGVKPTFTAACGVPDRDSGSETLALFFVPESSDPDEQLQTIIQIRQSVSKHLAVFARHIIPLTLDDFKKTTSGKIQRQEMKNNFLKGGYPQSIQLDKHFLTKEVIPDWFYKQKWRLSKDLIRENPESRIHFISLKDLHHVERTETAPENGRALIPAISQYVRDDGDSWGFLDIKSGPHNKTYIENQAIIVVDLTRTSLAIESIYDGLLKLYQSLSPLTLNGLSLQLYVFTYKKFQVVEGDSEQSMYSGLASLLKTMSLETTALHCRLIDIDDIPALATILKQEAGALTRRNLVAYRSSQRYALSLCKIRPPSDNNNKILFKTKGFYLVIGGLGGIGKELCQELSQRHAAHVLIFGRKSAEIVATELDWLRNNGVQCAYQAVDLNGLTLELLRQLCEHYENLWAQPLQGIIHLAGSFPQRLLSEESALDIMQVIKAKIAGLAAIHAFLSSKKEAVFIAFSSVNSFFGGVGSAAYAIANQIFNSTIHSLFSKGNIHYRILSWSMWRDAGMGKDYEYKELAKNKGFHLISNQQGLLAMTMALAHWEPHLYIGLDCSKPYIMQMIASQPRRLSTLWAYRSEASDDLTTRQLALQGQNGQRFEILIKPSGYYPQAIQHQIQLQQRKAVLDSDLDDTVQRTPLEIIAKTKKIWQEVLNHEDISIDSNFFDLGGSSLDIIRIKEQLMQSFAVDISIAQLFNSPTIATLASMIASQLSASATTLNRSLPGREQRRNRRSKRLSQSQLEMENLADEF